MRTLSVLTTCAILLAWTLTISPFCRADDQQSSVTGQLSLYVNGALQASIDCPSAWKAVGHTQLGRGLFDGKPVDFVTGLLGDVRVYDRALSATQIKALYMQGPQTEWHLNHTKSGLQAQPDQNGPLTLTGTGTSVDSGRSLLDTSRDYTISAWVSLSSTDGFQTFVSQDGKSLSGFYLQKRGDDGKFAFSVRDSDGPNPPQVIAESSLVPKVNTLYHIVGVFHVGPITASAPPPTPAAPPAPILTASLPWDAEHQGRFLESLAQDHQGHTWVATEDQGVWRFDPSSPAGQQWTQFTQKDGLGGDDVYALLVDGRNRVWAGTLHGVSVYDGKTWRTYGPVEGLGGFRVFALASCPTSGDVWIATDGGLTRYSLKADRWQQYSRLDGLPSDALQCLAFSKTGDLYVGTQADGIAMASAGNNYKTWRVVRGPASLPETAGGAGLPTSLINCLYVAHDGTVYAGTTTGLARSSDNGKTWRFLRGADWLDKRDGEHPQSWLDLGLSDQADVRAIEVLPQTGVPVRIAAGGSGQGEWGADRDFVGGQTFRTNDAIDSSAVLNPASQSVYQSARFGSFIYTVPGFKPGVPCRVRLHLAEVAYNKAGQRVFNVAVNGKRVLAREDIFAEAGVKDKVIVKEFTVPADAQGRIVLAFRGSQPLPSLDKHSPYELSEDYVTALSEDGAGHLLVGHWQKGVEVLDPQTGKHVAVRSNPSPSCDYVTAFFPRPDGTLLIGSYGDGLGRMPIIGTTSDGVFARLEDTPPPLTPPTPAAPPDATQLEAMLAQVRSSHREMPAGSAAYLGEDWQTQGDWVGRYGRQYARLCAMDHVLTCTDAYSVEGLIGYNRDPDDGLRWWTTWMQTDNPKSLYTPVAGNRRQAEWDDHGEAYPQTLAGPDIWIKVKLSEGDVHRISLYFMNKDGHDGDNRYRDYLIQVKPYRKRLQDADTAPTLAQARVHSFWGGVYEQFAVKSPGDYYIKVSKNYSHNTIISAVLIDKLAGEQTVTDMEPLAYMNQVRYDPTRQDAGKINQRSVAAATALWNALDASYSFADATDKQHLYRFLSYRAVQSVGGEPALLANWRWHLGMWDAEDRSQFAATMKRSFHATGLSDGIRLTSIPNK